MTLYGKAADILEQDGWGQGSYLNRETGCWCAMGAIMQAATKDGVLYNDDDLEPLRLALKDVDRHWLEDYNDTEDAVVGWNDEPGRAAKEVVDLLRKAEGFAKETPPVVQPDPF